MKKAHFKLGDRLLGLLLFIVAAFVYLSTIEDTTSFWDCGEFIASSYKLEIGHPPGNPIFQLVARFFTLFAPANKAALMVNAMSAICSALTIMFLFWTITHLGRRVMERGKGLSQGGAIAVWGAGVVGALIYTFSDTFWFSAVEAEVYAMSSLFTAVVFWAILKWEEQADAPYANRWIILIALLMGLSVGVHLLNLLAIPAIVFIYYYKKYESSPKLTIKVFAIAVVILAVVLFGVIPWLPKLSAFVDLFFVNYLKLPFNSGAALFVITLLALSLWAVWFTQKRGKVLLNTILLAFTMIVIGYSSFAMVIIRSSANTPTNENQPDNPFSLVRYLAREQYGSNPLIYGETYASEYSLESTTYWAKVGDRYKKVKGPVKQKFDSQGRVFFPRMWSSSRDHINFYKAYTQNRGKRLFGSEEKIPLFRDNLRFFFDYQLNWMYLRYFMWNFVGRQNDFHAPAPGDPFKGNWESGISFIDKSRLGDQSEGPNYLVNNRSKNHYYFLPLILGLVGLFFHLKHDKKNWWVVMLLFIMTGVAIVLYLNQPPYQPRERDYAFAGSFYAFAIWTGFAVLALYRTLKRVLDERLAALLSFVLLIFVPIQMGGQNWDDHNRSNRYTARDIAFNYLNSCDSNAILVTHGDNDTFPLWYLQEVEGVRTDVRVVNTSLLGTDWYIDQMQYRTYDSAPLNFSLTKEEYIYGTNDVVQIYDRVNRAVPLKAVVDLMSHPSAKVKLTSGESISVFAARELLVPVNKSAVLKGGIVPLSDSSLIVDTIQLSLPPSKGILTKTELMILDLIANYNWERPIYFVAMGGDLNIGIKEYLEFCGFAYKFVPIKSETSVGTPGRIVAQNMYNKVMDTYRWGNMNDSTIHIDYQNILTFSAIVSARNIFVQTAQALVDAGENEKAEEVLDRMGQEIIPYHFPLNSSLIPSLNEYSVLEAIDLYLYLGKREKGLELGRAFAKESLETIALYMGVLFSPTIGTIAVSKNDIDDKSSYILYLANIYRERGLSDEAEEVTNRLVELIGKF
ncbi:MAG: DUF2723 domain-containing protein [Bacteroidales bacterium]